MRLAGDSSEAVAGGAGFDDVGVEGHSVPNVGRDQAGVGGDAAHSLNGRLLANATLGFLSRSLRI
jgi:hypothetical protein